MSKISVNCAKWQQQYAKENDKHQLNPQKFYAIWKVLPFLSNQIDLARCKQKQPPEVFLFKDALKNYTNFTRKHLCWSLFLIKVYNFIKTPTQVPSREICEIFNNIYFEEHQRTTASWN